LQWRSSGGGGGKGGGGPRGTGLGGGICTLFSGVASSAPKPLLASSGWGLHIQTLLSIVTLA